MKYDDALAAVRRLCPPDVYAALVRGPRPAGGHVLARVAIEEQRTSGAGDPRAERGDEPTRRVGVDRDVKPQKGGT